MLLRDQGISLHFVGVKQIVPSAFAGAILAIALVDSGHFDCEGENSRERWSATLVGGLGVSSSLSSISNLHW